MTSIDDRVKPLFEPTAPPIAPVNASSSDRRVRNGVDSAAEFVLFGLAVARWAVRVCCGRFQPVLLMRDARFARLRLSLPF